MSANVLGGSLGKGTALKHKSDLDCVLILNEIEDVQQLMDEIGEIKENLRQCLSGNFSQQSFLLNWNLTITCETRFSLQFTMTRTFPHDEVVEVDLLPTFNIHSIGVNQLYRDMRRSSEIQQYCSAALTELQRDFVKILPSRIKDLIRLVKYWCKKFVKKNDGKVVPSSYLLELITINAWEKAGKPTTINMAIAFKAVMHELKHFNTLNVAWHCNYQENQEMDYSELPRVLDPANPYNNVCAAVDCWERVKEIAEETMDKPLFRDVIITSHWCRGPPPIPSKRPRRKKKPLQVDNEFEDFM